MSLTIKRLYEFGEFRLDTLEKTLICGDRTLAVTPKAFELLTLLIENQGRLLKKDEIMRSVWTDSFVEESNLTFNIGQLRKILGDSSRNSIYIKTVHQQGYRFIAPVKEIVEECSPTNSVEENPPVETAEENPATEPVEDPPPAVEAVKPVQNFLFRPFSKVHLAVVALIILLVSSLAVALILNRNFKSPKSNTPILETAFKSEKLTNTGGVFLAIISPDGRRMAYSSENGGKEGLWIRRLETSENIQIVSNSDDKYFGLAFSHDGETLYFSRGKATAEQTIYRVSALGGIPKEIASKTEGWLSLSPDDRQISFVRCPYQEDDYCSLYIADTDGRNERQLLKQQRPIRIGDNKFSPDGKSVAVARGQSRNGSQEFGLIDVDINTGAEREITGQKFFDIKYLDWLPDKSGLLLTALDRFNHPIRIYEVSNETGEIKTLTNDSNSYSQISLDDAFQKMVATQVVSDFHLWMAPANAPDSAKPIASAQGKGVFTTGGKFVYDSITDGTHNIWIINPDGTNQRQLTSNQGSNLDPRVSADERFIYFTSNRSGSKQIWRMNIDGSKQIQVSEGEGGQVIFVSPDGNTVFYETALYSNLGKITVSSDGTSASSIVSKEKLLSAEFNSTGETVAYYARNSEGNYQIVLMSVADGKILKTFDLFEKNPLRFKLLWAADGRSIFYLTTNELKTTIWQLFIETGKSVKFTELTSGDEIMDFTFSPDDKMFAYVRGKWRHDAFLIKGLK